MKTYSVSERKQIAQVFKEAKKYLWDGAGDRNYFINKFICLAIKRSLKFNINTQYEEAAYEALQIIEERLDGFSTVGEWLWQKGGVDTSFFDVSSRNQKNYVFRQLQLYRHRWLDSLIKEFSN